MSGATVEHGGDLPDVILADAGDWLDLSTGINPWPYPVGAIARTSWTRLPGRVLVGTTVQAAAQAFRVPDPACIALGPGSQALIHLLPGLFPHLPARVLAPCYSGYAQAFHAAGRPLAVAADLASAVAQGRLVLVANPNNPDGRQLAAGALAAAARSLAETGGVLVVDEAFADLDEGQSLGRCVGVPGLVVLRSFGKFYGLAGLRLGALLAPQAVAAAATERLGPWAVAGPALEVGARAWSDADWQAATRRRLAAGAARLDRVLAATGLRIVGGTALYRLAEHPQAHAIAERLAAQHVFVRRFTDWPTWLRFGLPPSGAAERRLKAALLDAVPPGA
ncbi:threonine-phosphate decarboxylase CobD [Zavarzinia sp. CC-PAN008]|uniref:threonine-phosphate decarboxylase CobD n=1 Tax=Zavarzinia sp. CC-PAN008 TaxID=3243332 RepID=UPI003F74AD12